MRAPEVRRDPALSALWRRLPRITSQLPQRRRDAGPTGGDPSPPQPRHPPPPRGPPKGGGPRPPRGDFAPRLSSVIGNYRLVELLGKGGMGVVYRVEHVYMGTPAAIKILHDRHAGESEAIERFLQEARAAA